MKQLLLPIVIFVLSLDEIDPNTEKSLVKIIDFMGIEVEFKPNTPLIYTYSVGSAEKVYRVE